jgi:class 3 adenylate cyclase
MAEPRIQYTTTRDGVSIAYWKTGSGPPLVQLPGSLVAGMTGVFAAEVERWRDRLAERNTVVRYDHRGFGQSQHGVSAISLDTLVLDLEAVVEQLGQEPVALVGMARSGPVAIAYAARHPERVSHLVLFGTSARGETFFAGGGPRQQAMQTLAEEDWETYTELVAHETFGWDESVLARRYAAALREGNTREVVQAANDAIRRFDVTALLPGVRSPTLVLFRRQVTLPPPEESRLLASRIPGAQLVALEGDRLVPYIGDMESVLAAIEDFLARDERPKEAASPTLPSGTAIILFADIADSTALTERLGDTAFREKARELDAALRALIRECAGTPVEGPTLGDGVLAVFTSAREAIEAALTCGRAGNDAGLPLHLGLHAGDVTRETDPDGRSNVFGGAVNIASRIADESAPGETLVSGTVRDLARTSAGVLFEDRGERELKGVSEPVRLYEVRWREEG